MEAFFQTVFDVGHPVETLESVAFTANRFCYLRQYGSGDAVLGRDAVALAGHLGGHGKPPYEVECLCDIHGSNLEDPQPKARINKINIFITLIFLAQVLLYYLLPKNKTRQSRGCGLSGATYS